ncbi:DUF3888 domain-containing protein [Cytobacillus purgationiresistens]|uniref:DUF3888 domain-containing protein n=1 Tax=Cytobacillus purgationiresistens TaxID=863449 RepID=A0ABU0AKP9_9BACI|nr:DUF3888 domain-containing protein [Cytobacillus purgationiresistens]MDQ0271459.1 hypothetical protein [Cytobacillus purgationiresistens]
MKKLFIGLSFSILILWIHPLNMAAETEIESKLVYDTLLTTLEPHISEAVAAYYGYHKQYGLYDTTIKKIKRTEKGSYHFIVTVQVQTFEAAHNPPYGKEKIKFDVSPIGIKTIKFKHRGDEDEAKLNQFYRDALRDINKSFHLRLNAYEKYNHNQLHYLAERQPEYQSLANIVADIVIEELNPTIKPPYKNSINPVTFIKGKQGYILFKKSDGSNVVYRLVYEKNNWIVKLKDSKSGKEMKKELLWYM